MKKIILGLCMATLIGFASQEANAQGSVGLELGGGIPLYGFNDGVGFGLGFGATADYMLSNEMSVGALFTYQMLSFDTDGISYSQIPLLARFGYYLTPEFVVGADVGAVISRTSVDRDIFPLGNSSSSTNLALGAHVGYTSAFGFGAEARWLHFMDDTSAGLLQFVANYKFMF